MSKVGTFRKECPVCGEMLQVPMHSSIPHLHDAGATCVTVKVTPDREFLERHFASHPHGGGEPTAMTA